MKPEIFRFDDEEKCIAGAADYIRAIAIDSVKTSGRFSFALSGGNTPKGLYERLARLGNFPWDKTHLFWGDERLVPPNHRDSNYRMASKAMIMKVSIPLANVHRVLTELEDGLDVASAYEAELRMFFQCDSYPVFDLILLGVGTDGHTASLFPDSPILKSEDWVATDRSRVTLTLPVINSASNVAFFVMGEDKKQIVDGILNKENPEYPAAMVHNATWFIGPLEKACLA